MGLKKEGRVMMPTVRPLLIAEVAKQTGKSWEEVAKEKMKSDFICLILIGVVFAAVCFLYNCC